MLGRISQKNMELTIYALKIPVSNLTLAKDFYTHTLRFTIKSSDTNLKEIELEASEKYKLILSENKNLKKIDPYKFCAASFTLMVNNIDSAISRLKKENVVFPDNNIRSSVLTVRYWIERPASCRAR